MSRRHTWSRVSLRRGRAAATTALWLLPPGHTKNALLQRIGHRIAPDARLGVGLALACDSFEVGPGAAVGHGNIFRNLRSVQLGERCSIDQLNHFTATEHFQEQFHEAGQLARGELIGHADAGRNTPRSPSPTTSPTRGSGPRSGRSPMRTTVRLSPTSGRPDSLLMTDRGGWVSRLLICRPSGGAPPKMLAGRA